MKQYQSIKEKTEIEIIIKKSKFIGFLIPVDSEDNAVKALEEIRKNHKDANHNCFAIKLGPGGEFQKCSDDGEPQGTAGKPILEILNKENITNVLAVVTRYFGGVKLGTGGLIRAYSQTVKEALKASEIIISEIYWEAKLSVDYKDLESIKNALLNDDIIIKEINYMENVILNILIPVEFKEMTHNKIVDITCGKNEIIFIKKIFWEGSSFNPKLS
ncbi:uncharacterized protein, YigZ family [Desulfonispora thiosulfatigenes DSM 11270]|uniref:Uncharacterized protein, YigZ family n=1 Tax=Desulfonispora thiosulfatigenes DSM 11270 TaxID=656914 RepID=A0A1W1VSK9_DESTI|nr:YigZ family protein [Desulfonispora thiosulfatigenes]SMB96375.1 uncharacterized protein, YigZ family [Desulfonispora thiosulfatigenes DSM 11270]